MGLINPTVRLPVITVIKCNDRGRRVPVSGTLNRSDPITAADYHLK